MEAASEKEFMSKGAEELVTEALHSLGKISNPEVKREKYKH